MPEKAREFVKNTEVDALAIAFGTAHGVYAAKPVLDLQRIMEIKKKIDIPLVMHGGSGVSSDEFKTAIQNGIKKINYYTYMALAGADRVKKFLYENRDDDSVQFHDIVMAGKEGMKENVKIAMNTFLMK